MSDDIEDDDEIFYGGAKPGSRPPDDMPEDEHDQGTRAQDYDGGYVPSTGPDWGQEPVPDGETEEPAKSEADIESEISRTRQEKMRAAEYHDITRLRQKAAEHSAEAAKFFRKYRAEEAAMVKYQEAASRARRKAEGYIAKSKDIMAKADDKQSDLAYLEGGKAERTRVKVAKLKAKAARLKSKASSFQAKSAKYTQKAAARREKAKAYLERSKTHEAEALNYNKRADNLQKVQGA